MGTAVQPQSGELLGIAIRARSRGPMEELSQVAVTESGGLDGDFRGQPGGRQVTVLAAEAWEAACLELGSQLPWTTRRANLLVRGIKLLNTAGALLQIGDVLLEIRGETEPCQRMEEALPGLLSALTPDWRGGVCCRVLEAGELAIGSPVQLCASTD